MSSNYKKLGDYIQPVNRRNTDLKVETLLGVSIQKILMPSIANTVGTNMKTYKIIKKNQFAYGPVTSRNGDKISIALLQDFDEAIISQAYTVFEVVDTEKLHPEYLMMWFRRPEFDRYARFKSHGSARETFDWDEMCEVELPIPSIEKQREIVKEYNTVTKRIKLNEQINQKLEETAQALYKHWFVDFEFPNKEGKPYKSSGGEMVYNEELDKDIPKGWSLELMSEVIPVKDGTHDSPKPVDEGLSLITSTHLRPYDLDLDSTYKISLNDFNQINKRSLVEQYDILFSMIGTIGLIHFVSEENINYAIKNVALFKCSQNENLAKYILFYLKGIFTKEYIKGNLAGSTQSYVTLTTLRNIPLLRPKLEILLIFNKQTKALIDNILLNTKQSQTLQELQSLLLAKMTKVEDEKEMV